MIFVKVMLPQGASRLIRDWSDNWQANRIMSYTVIFCALIVCLSKKALHTFTKEKGFSGNISAER